jgi:hypothetical protein
MATGIFDQSAVNKLKERVSSGNLISEVQNMALSAIISTQILIHQYIKKDAFRPPKRTLKDCSLYRH